jgi:hypothetical protein
MAGVIRRKRQMVEGLSQLHHERFAASGAEFVNKILGMAFPDNAIKHPSETIVFGEKQTTSPHFYMDFLETAAGHDKCEKDDQESMIDPATGVGNVTSIQIKLHDDSQGAMVRDLLGHLDHAQARSVVRNGSALWQPRGSGLRRALRRRPPAMPLRKPPCSTNSVA